MDIKITDSLLREYLSTTATAETIAEHLSLCGPTVDRLEKVGSDWLYHIEVITNRIDSASAFGIAREAVAILSQHNIKASLINNPYQKTINDIDKLPNTSPAKVTITDSTLAPRFTCVALKNVTIKPSETATQKLLEMHGERSLNNVIDISNELTLRYGQPVHVFDLDRITNQTLKLRLSRKGESITTLDERTHVLKGDDIVIEDGAGRLIDLCGIMGGDLSAVTEKTKNVLLFVQSYSPKHIRRTSLYTQERTRAAQLFEKQPDPEMVLPVLIEGVQMLIKRAGAVVNSNILDLYTKKKPAASINLDLNWLKSFTGITIPDAQVLSILHHLGFKTTQNKKNLACTAPSWRLQDIHHKEDLAEEITRVYGYYRLPSILPITDIPAIATDPLLTLEMKTRKYLVALGFTEIYNSALISTPQLKLTGVSESTTFKLANPLSEEYLYMRPSLIPSLIDNLNNNQAATKSLLLFELSNTYHKQPKKALAREIPTLCLAVSGLPFREFKGYVDALHKQLHIQANPDSLEGTFKQHQEYWLFETSFEKLAREAKNHYQFKPISSFAPLIEDLTFTLPPQSAVGPIINTMQACHKHIDTITLKDIYQRNHTFTITYQSFEKNLSSDEIAPIRKKIVTHLKTKHRAQLVGKLQ